MKPEILGYTSKFFYFSVLVFIVLYGCSSDNRISENLHPYNNFQGIFTSKPITERFYLFPEVLLDSTQIIQNILPVSYERGFDVSTTKDGKVFLYLWDSNILYLINENGEGIEVAGFGNDPFSIQSGVRLHESGESLHLIQRARISEVHCTPECRLSVLDTYENFDMLNAFYRMPDGKFLVSSWQRLGEQTIHLINRNFEVMCSAGEFFRHSNPSLVALFNSGILISDRQEKRFIHLYGNFPNIALYDQTLKLRQVYRIHDFYVYKMEVGLESFATDYEIDFLSPHSFLVNSYPIRESKFWVIVAHQRHLNRQIGFESIETAFFFDYYILEEEIGLTYMGSFQYYAVPQGEYLYVLKEHEVYRVDVPIEQRSEFQHEVFDFPDGF